jgi:GDP-6-deoxy-D-talose 4-dehydrogenase
LAGRSERVLITGGSGFTGRPLTERLRQDGYDVIASAHQGGDADTLEMDLRDFDAVTRALSRLRPQAIVHLAGIAAPSHSNIGEIYSSNVVGTANLFAALASAKLEPRIVIVASSGQVYAADGTDRRLTEDDALAPKTHYAISKRAGEDIAAVYSRNFPVIVTRPFNYTGPAQTSSFLVPKIVQHYAERRSEIRLGNLDLFRDFSDIERVVEAYARLIAQTLAPTTVNICSGRTVHLQDIIKLLEEISGHSLRLVIDPALLRGGEPRVIVGSPERLEGLIGSLPNPEFRDTLARMFQALCEKRLDSVQ